MRLALALLMIATTASAQDRAGRDTPGEWKITHHKPFGLWDSMCDERQTGDVTEERCYLRYVDVFSPRPNFAAMFAFITPDNRVEFGIEKGTTFSESGFRLEKDGAAIWAFGKDRCLSGGTCSFTGDAATALKAQMRAADRFVFDFVDRHGQARVLEWDMTRFSDALAVTDEQAHARGL